MDEVPREGEVYTVTKVRLKGRDNVTGKVGPALALKEICGSLPGCQMEVCWLVRRFAPLDLQQSSTTENQKGKRRQRKKSISPVPQPQLT